MFTESKYQKCTVHFYRNVFTVVPRSKVKDVAAMLKAIHAQEDKAVVEKLTEMKLNEAAKKVEDSVKETLTYMGFPREHRLRLEATMSLNG